MEADGHGHGVGKVEVNPISRDHILCLDGLTTSVRKFALKEDGFSGEGWAWFLL